VDSRELVSAWVLSSSTIAPIVTRSYDIDVFYEKSVSKKIIFRNPWNMDRTFRLISSNENVMITKDETLTVSARGSAFLRLLFKSSSQTREVKSSGVYLFLNDDAGLSEECFLFNIHHQ
jgi:hypothetical protein